MDELDDVREDGAENGDDRPRRMGDALREWSAETRDPDDTGTDATPEADARDAELYRQMQRDVATAEGRVGEPRTEWVKVGDLAAPGSYSDWHRGSPAFWDHHGNGAEEYRRLADPEKLENLRLALQRDGRSLEDVRADPNLAESARFWLSDHDKWQAIRYEGRLFTESGFHRAELARELGAREVPVAVSDLVRRDEQQRRRSD